MSKAQEALDAHSPRPEGDPWYVPYWAKGMYAKMHGTKWAFDDGTQVESGIITSRKLKMTDPKILSPEIKFQADPETPGPTLIKRPKAPKLVDQASKLVAECNGKPERIMLCMQHGIDPSILDAPNAGVATMRLLNALRSHFKLQDTLGYRKP